MDRNDKTHYVDIVQLTTKIGANLNYPALYSTVLSLAPINPGYPVDYITIFERYKYTLEHYGAN